MQVEIVDVSCLCAGALPSQEAKTLVARQIAKAIRTVGAFYVVGHGMTEEYIQSMFSTGRKFFAVDKQTKTEIPIKPGGFTRGYVGVGGESGSHRLECKEAFSYGYEWPKDTTTFTNSLQGQNVWPNFTQFDGGEQAGLAWQEELVEFYNKTVAIAEAVARGLSLALNFDEDYLLKFCTEGNTISLMRIFHYFPYSSRPVAVANAPSTQERIGSSPHTDWGFLTLVLQDGSGGLEVFYEDTWQAVPPVPGSFVVNCGDYLALLSGSAVHSPLHRVCCGDTDRISYVFFYYPSYDSAIPNLATDQELSLLKDQRHNNNNTNNTSPAGVPFGQYIAGKWDQVYRTT